MTIEAWPGVLKARRWDPHLRNLSASGGTSPTGRTQRVFGDGGFWEIAIGGIAIRNREQAAAYRALAARLRAGEDIFLPVRDLYQPLGSRIATASAVLLANAALRSTQVSLLVSGVEVKTGHHFTIGDRLHLVTGIAAGPIAPPLVNQLVTRSPWSRRVPWSSSVVASAAYTLEILPPLRADLTAGEPARFRDLGLRCVIKDPADGDLDLDLGRFGTPNLTFIESL